MQNLGWCYDSWSLINKVNGVGICLMLATYSVFFIAISNDRGGIEQGEREPLLGDSIYVSSTCVARRQGVPWVMGRCLESACEHVLTALEVAVVFGIMICCATSLLLLGHHMLLTSGMMKSVLDWVR